MSALGPLATARLARADATALFDAMCAIAASALSEDNGNDTATVVYSELSKLGIHVP